MLETGIFHNGACELPVIKTPSGYVVSDGTLEEVNRSYQQTLINEVRQAVLADRLGFNYFFLTEHHFQPEGAEFNPNPLITETAIAALTRQIRLGQAANILTWHHPIRLAEQVASLDVLSGGRVEFGIGRGYQSRETEVLGWPFATIQDQERNRAYFDEAYEIIMKAWTQSSFSHRGQFYTIPPVFTRWNHAQTMAYFDMEKVERSVENVLQLGPVDPYGGSNPVLQSYTLLKELQVFPRTLQKPHPQVWQPLSTSRSMEWAAARGVNGYFIVEPISRMQKNVEIYYKFAEKNGWPDRLGRGRFKYGWDAEKRRGVGVSRFVHLTLPGKDKDRELERWKLGQELQWSYYGPFGFGAILSEVGEPPPPADKAIPAELILKNEIGLYGTPADVAAKIIKVKEQCGFEDFMFCGLFETAGFAGEEVEEQMQYFAEEVVPILARACGGLKKNPPVDVSLSPTTAEPGRSESAARRRS